MAQRTRLERVVCIGARRDAQMKAAVCCVCHRPCLDADGDVAYAVNRQRRTRYCVDCVPQEFA